jgi:hypothetical protein
MTDEKNQDQDRTDYAMAAAVARYVDLNEVRLGELSAKLIGSRDALIQAAPWDLRFKRNMSAKLDEARKSLIVLADLAVDVVAHDPAISDALNCSCVYQLEYGFNVSGGPQGEDLRQYLAAFANVNGIYNAWPYFRELVQSMASRAGLPPIVLPVFRVARPSAPVVAPPAVEPQPAVKGTSKPKGAKAASGRK